MLMDFTFKNDLIRKYFEGDNSYVPSSELVYLHEHPLIKNSFLVELELMINRVAERANERNMQGPIINKFIEATCKLGAELPNVNQKSAPIILSEMRKVYFLCTKLLN